MHQAIISLGVKDAKELIFEVIFTIRGHWVALESKITKIKNSFKASDNSLTRVIDPKELIFEVIFTIRGHWVALESKITKIKKALSIRK